MVDDDQPLYDPKDPALWALLGDLHRHTMHYGPTVAVCGAAVSARQRTDITALVNCQQCLVMVPPPERGHWAVAYGPKREEM
jgi:hypothetical protein